MGFVSEIKEIIEETHDKIPMPIRIEYKRAENLNMGHVYKTIMSSICQILVNDLSHFLSLQLRNKTEKEKLAELVRLCIMKGNSPDKIEEMRSTYEGNLVSRKMDNIYELDRILAFDRLLIDGNVFRESTIVEEYISLVVIIMMQLHGIFYPPNYAKRLVTGEFNKGVYIKILNACPEIKDTYSLYNRVCGHINHTMGFHPILIHQALFLNH